nr:MAG TPA: holin [Caudoviricetes sp.]
MHDCQFPLRAYQVMEYIETYFRMFFAVTVLTVVSDVKDFIFLVVIVTVLNWLAGYMAGRKKGEKYQHKKTMQAVKELFLTNAILFFVALTCSMLEPSIDYKLIIKALTGIFLIIYARNITKNLRIIQPSNEFIRVLNSIANSKYFQMKKKIKDGDFEIPKKEKDGRPEETNTVYP